ncbi:MAG: UDP-N-acetylmuramate--L-alanine ligase [Bacteroidales bacterium]|nr:UDP-N-acetylmuramate--L-alanine ligase [Bacteroidales bacterium]
MNYKNIHKVYFIGIGGIGMSALARFFNQFGADVSGYDLTETKLTMQLQKEGIQVHYDDNPLDVPSDADLYIYTPAIPDDHKELKSIRDKGIKVYKRSEILGLLARNFKAIAVAGTHGKTTTSSIITHLLLSANRQVNAFIGGISVDLDSNFVFSDKAELMVVEADEYDRSFLNLYPDVAVITAIDEDHLDVYGSAEQLISTFDEFMCQVNDEGRLIVNEAVETEELKKKPAIRYGFSEGLDLYAENLRIAKGQMLFDIRSKNHKWTDLNLSMPGRHNVENALAAIQVCMELGMSEEEIRSGLNTYSGVQRRFEIRVNKKDQVYVDDYAHHPKELEACIKAARSFFPGKKITGAFQPHLFSRTRDFADGFAKSLQLLDEIILLDIYPAREKPIPGINTEMLAQKIGIDKVKVLSKRKLLEYVEHNKPELFLTLGAGDIDNLVEPITKILSKE